MTLPRFDAKAAGAAIVAIAIAVAMVLVVQAGAATAAPTDVVIKTKAPVKPKQFRGDVRRLKRPTPFPRRPTVEPGEHHEEESGGKPKTGRPAAPPIPKATTAMPATTVNFAGLDFTNWGAGWPPDTVGDVSETHYVQAVNTSIGIWAKTGGAPLAAFTFASLWSGAATGTPCDTSHNGDPTVIYDQMAKRWIVADFSWTNIQNGPYYECIAVSKTSNPVTGGWWLYAYRADDVAHPWLPDYPKMGIWPDGLYMTTNMFDCLNASCSSASYEEVRVYAFDRADMYAGAPLSSIVVDLDSDVLLQPAAQQRARRPASRRTGEPPRLGGVPDVQFRGLEVPRRLGDARQLDVHRPHQRQPDAYNQPVPVPQPGTMTQLDSLGDRMQMQNQYRNLGGTESLWVNHTVRTGTSTPNGIQWAQINVTGGFITQTPVQQQIYGNLGGDGVHRWMGSLAVDGQGNMALGYSASNASMFSRPSATTAGWPAILSTRCRRARRRCRLGGGSQTGFNRWGDYSAMTVDPDDCTFWYTTEYLAATGNTGRPVSAPSSSPVACQS